MLTIAYMTSRKRPMIEWFFDSLHNEAGCIYDDLQIVVVDFHAATDGRREQIGELTRAPITHVSPKPTWWQGPCRATAVDYFAAANARNTAVCHAKGEWIVFVDDLSVLLPGWLKRVRAAMDGNYVVGGAYRKVQSLVVTDGHVVFCRETDSGTDSRWSIGSDSLVTPLYGGSLFGCSMAMPIASVLAVNGYDERCDCLGLGSEDYILGLMLENTGHTIRYDRRMLTYESEERHHNGDVMKRVIEVVPGKDKDASWAILNSVRPDAKRAPNPFDLAALRDLTLAGAAPTTPYGEPINWYSGKSAHEY